MHWPPFRSVGAFIGEQRHTTQPAFTLSQHQQETLGVESLGQVGLPVAELASRLSLGRPLGDIPAVGE